jgi:lysophospholipase
LLDVAWNNILRPVAIRKFRSHKYMDPNVAAIRLFPGITVATVKAFMSSALKGVVIETFGAGNAPNNRPEILEALKIASERGVVLVNCTQVTYFQFMLYSAKED